MEVTLSDHASLQKCFENLKILPKIVPPSQYVLTASELMGLNYLLLLSPDEILFFDTSSDQLEYMKLIIELLLLSETEEEFISRVFSRPLKAFIQEKNTLFPFSKIFNQQGAEDQIQLISRSLNEFTQWAYLATSYDKIFLEQTFAKLSKAGKHRYELFLLPYLKGHIQFENRHCPRLLPCWPFGEPIPFSKEGFMGKNLYGECEPNTNTFYYGNLWLAKKETFQAIKQKLQKAYVHFKLFDPFQDTLKHIINTEENAAIYVGCLERNDKWSQIEKDWKKLAKTKALSIITESRVIAKL